MQQAWKDQVAALGGKLLEYLPEFAFKVRMTPEQAVKSPVAERGLGRPLRPATGSARD